MYTGLWNPPCPTRSPSPPHKPCGPQHACFAFKINNTAWGLRLASQERQPTENISGALRLEDRWHGVILSNSIYLYIFLGKRMYNLEAAGLTNKTTRISTSLRRQKLSIDASESSRWILAFQQNRLIWTGCIPKSLDNDKLHPKSTTTQYPDSGETSFRPECLFSQI